MLKNKKIKTLPREVILLFVAFLCVFSHYLHSEEVKALWEDPTIVQENRLPARSHFFSFFQDPNKFVYTPWDAQNYLNLNGIWQFQLSSSPFTGATRFYENDASTADWGTIKVPGNWSLNGYGVPNYVNMRADFAPDENPLTVNKIPRDTNTTGRYKRVFTVSEEWKGKTVIAYLGAVKSAFKLWVNGHYVGYSQDSKTAAEFDITEFIVPGSQNAMAIEVYRWSDGSYLELQDMWRLNGIERDVYLYATPQTRIQDITLNTTTTADYQNGLFGAEVSIVGNQASNSMVDFTVYDENGDVVLRDKQPISIQENKSVVIVQPTVVKGVQFWSHESPTLYSVRLRLLNKAKEVTQVAWLRAGFRTSELKGGNVLINGKPVLFKGVNRHEHDPLTGHVISEASMRKDLTLMKSLNINAVRNSHYPNHPLWYALADEYGMYLVDEANIESHGVGAANQGHSYIAENHMVNMPEWRDAYVDRIRNMYEASKNHASVVMLSPGNESGDGDNTEYLYHWLKQRTSLPVMFEQAQLRPHTDVYAQMYASLDLMQSFVEIGSDRPMILCEYQHAMGNSVGNLKEYWDLIYKHESLQGGFIWDWVDQTITTTTNEGVEYQGYGGDFEKAGQYHDGNFSANGLLTANREFHPHAYEVQHVYQNIFAEWDSSRADKVLIRNGRYFTGLDDVYLRWERLEQGQVLQSGIVESLSIPPGESATIAIPNISQMKNENRYHTNLYFVKKSDSLSHKKGDVVAQIQLSQPFQNNEKGTIKSKGGIEERSDALILHFKDNEYTVSKNTGWLSSVQKKGKEVLKTPMIPWFWRAPTDNDFGEGFPQKSKVWIDVAKHAELISITEKEENEAISVVTKHRFPTVQSEYHTTYTLTDEGNILIDAWFLAAPNQYYPALPRIGYRFELVDDYESASWFGRGPHENYWDRKSSAFFGRYSLPIAELSHGYVRPQENGHRADVYEVSFSEKNNAETPSITFKGRPLIGFNAQYTDWLDYDTTEKTGLHPHEIPVKPNAFINIDFKQRGVAGTDSWMTPPLFKYTLPWRDYHYQFEMALN